MARLLIVDDEPLILENLYVLFREADDMELEVYRAESAEKALSIMDDVAIDILITDIMMPGMNGLELQARAIERLPDIKVIVLTSYSDFSLIQAAQRNGSIDYVMKSEPEHVLMEAVQMTVAMLDAEILNRRRLSDLKSIQDELAQVDRMFALAHFLETGDMPKQDTPFDLEGDMPAVVLTARTDSGSNAILAGRMGLALFSGDMRAGYTLLPDGCLVMLLQPRKGNTDRDWSLIQQRISSQLTHLQRGFEADTASRLAICVSEGPILARALRRQSEAQRRILEGADSSALLTLGDACLEGGEAGPSDSSLRAILNSGDRRTDSAPEENIVMTIERYAMARMGEDLSLQRIAAMLHYHPVYLSRMFKNVAGVNYSTWISDLRLAQARKLLEQEQLKIQDISERLGFESPSYFTRFFKKKAGISPAQWRSRRK